MPAPTGPIVVIGGALPGMAAAARLAALGHEVVLIEREPALGGRWRTSGDGIGRTDALPPVLTLPAAWRDLFRKTGRTLDLELKARGWTLDPAPPAVHSFPDGSALVLPTDRGSQHTALTEALGREHATAWRDLLDRLDDAWQALRRLGLEEPFGGRRAVAPRRRALLWGTTVADLARTVPAPLSYLVAATAWRIGSHPRRTPAFVAARLSVERSFGRWSVADAEGHGLPAGVLLDVLADRLRARGVEARPATTVHGGGVSHVLTDSEAVGAGAVITTVHPWHDPPLGPTRRLFTRLRPAMAPRVTHRLAAGAVTGTTEEIDHTPHGPVVTYARQAGDDALTTVHDHTAAAPDPSAGARWDGPHTWSRMPGLRGAAGWWSATAAAPGGNDPWAQLLTGALAAYAVHGALTGEDVRPSNVAYRPRVRRRSAAAPPTPGDAPP